MALYGVESIDRPVRVVLCGKSLCVRGIEAHLKGLATESKAPLNVSIDPFDDTAVEAIPDADVVFICASECSGHEHPEIYALTQQRYPEARVIALSPRAHSWNLVTALDAEAKGFVACGIDGVDELVSVMVSVLAGDIAFSNEVSRLIVTTLRNSGGGNTGPAFTTQLGEHLSGREHGVLVLLCEGLTNQQIANALGLSPNTIKNHLSRVYTKLGVASRAEAVSTAIKSGLV